MLRLLVSPTRSGSTAFLRCFENNPAVEKVYHQPVKSGYRQGGQFDYSFFSLDEDEPEKIFVAKETVGGFARPETEFTPIPDSAPQLSISSRFPSPEAIEKVRPLFLLRDPLQTWNSIAELNEYSRGRSRLYSPFEYFITSYKNVADFMLYAKKLTPHAYCLTLELLALDPARILQSVCEKWEIPYHPAMVEWSLPYGANTEYSQETLERMENDPRFKRSKEKLEQSWRFTYQPSRTIHVSPDQEGLIERELRPLYDQAVIMAERDFPLHQA